MNYSWITCGGAKINCTSSNSEAGSYDTFWGDIDPEVAGYGVIFAFLPTAAITLCAIYFGYITGCLDSAELNRIDAEFIKFFRKILCLSPLSQEKLASHKKARKVRSEALLRFVLSFSDQQLVTGLAILIASFAKRCTITGTNFQIATSLAWFSSVTHLATLSVLRLYFMQRPWVRILRLLGMITVLGLLLTAELIPAFIEWEVDITVQCAINMGIRPGYFSHNTVSSLVSDPVTGTWLILYLLIAYANRIISLYNKNSQLSASETALQSLHKRNEMASPISYQHRAKQMLSGTHWTTKRIGSNKVRHQIFVIYLLYSDLLNSFFWELSFATFGLIYGLTEIITSRWPLTTAQQPIDIGDQMSFGQIVPLLLLILPVLTAVEVREDLHVLISTPSTPSTRTSSSSHSNQDVSNDPPVAVTTAVDPLERVTRVSLTSLVESTRVPNETANTEAEAGAHLAHSLVDLQRHSGESITAQATATDEDWEPTHHGLHRNRGTERSIGIELQHSQSSANPLPIDSNESLTQKQLDEIYNLPNANKTIGALVFLLYAVLALFILTLNGIISSTLSLPFMYLWAIWYFWGFLSFFYKKWRSLYSET